MSWKFPEHPVKPGGVVEIDDLNRGLTKYAEELDGGLNEHNWEKDSFTKSHCAEDVSMRVWKKSVQQDPSHHPSKTLEEYHPVKNQPAWFPISSENYTASQTVSTKSTTLWVMASLQHYNDHDQFAYGLAQYAIRINGTLIPESITGGSGSTHDVVHHNSQNIEVPPFGLHPDDPHRAVVFGAGINMRFRSVSLDALVSVPAGTHLVELCVRLTSGDNRGYFYVGARQLIVLSLRK